ncbi:MAG TPA: L,D-transpeptidase family protein [Mycobacteriales bacterium]|nr:L,D-transpeptidase family protein [Mycobacteriales bacterium]
MSGWRAALLVPVAFTAAVACGTGGSINGTAPPTPAPTTPGATLSPAPTTSPTSPPPTTKPPVRPPVSETLRIGDHGARVLQLQQGLVRLGYWLGTPDGTFGEDTEQAVYALQHVAGLQADGVAGRQTLSALARGARPVPRTASGDALEVDIEQQVLLVVIDGRLDAILHVSSGGDYLYVDSGVTSRASTPRGRYRVERRVDGWDHSTLGWLWRPAYFVGGYALHGYAEVPPYPASHGCVRVSMAGMNWLWATGAVRVGQPMWVY